MNSLRRSLLLALATSAAALALAAPAGAILVIPSGGEPTYTKGTTNSFWFQYQPAGAELYCWRYRVNGGPENAPDGSTCYSYNSASNVDIKRTLSGASGSTYYYYAERYIDLSGWTYYPCAGFGGCSTTTTLDASKPAITTAVNGTDVYTRNPNLQVSIGYQDSISPPWYGPNNGVGAANWVRLQLGSPSDPGTAAVNYSPGCSNKQNGVNNRFNSFSCTFDLTSYPDGTWHACARSADAAVPDNPNGTNQFTATADQANISDVACGYITLDRGAPDVTANAGATQVTTGQLVNFSASATDGLSGVPNGYDWDFGDNTPHGSGATTTHTYTQPGTYVAKASTTDGAGNPGSGTRTIVVTSPSSGGTGGTGGTTNTSGGTVQQTIVKETTISSQAGGGGTQSATVAGLDVVTPKKFRAGKRTLLMALSPESAGSFQIALVRSGKIYSKGAAKFTKAGTFAFKLKVPKKLKAGRYLLKVTWKPAGGRAKSKTFKLKVTAARKSSSRRKVVVSGAPAKFRSGVPYGGRR